MKKVIFVLFVAVGIILSMQTFSTACETCGCSAAAKSEGHVQEKASEAKEVVFVDNKVCPVMGASIIKEHALYVEYKGKIYSFCCPGCIPEFKKDPEKYIKIIEETKKENKK